MQRATAKTTNRSAKSSATMKEVKNYESGTLKVVAPNRKEKEQVKVEKRKYEEKATIKEVKNYESDTLEVVALNRKRKKQMKNERKEVGSGVLASRGRAGLGEEVQSGPKSSFAIIRPREERDKQSTCMKKKQDEATMRSEPLANVQMQSKRKKKRTLRKIRGVHQSIKNKLEKNCFFGSYEWLQPWIEECIDKGEKGRRTFKEFLEKWKVCKKCYCVLLEDGVMQSHQAEECGGRRRCGKCYHIHLNEEPCTCCHVQDFIVRLEGGEFELDK
jgi:hypothetical protein